MANITIATRTSIQRRVRKAATASAVATGGAMLGAVGLAYYVAHVLTAPKRADPMDDFVMTPFETGADFEEVAFAPLVGEYLLRGWWLPCPETDRVIIGCHGYRGSKAQLVGIGTILWRAGYNVLLFDFNGHGASAGSSVTLGYHETQDFCAAIEYVTRRMPQAQIGVIGFSMGASVAIMGAAQRPEIRCVIADSPFATHLDVVSHNVERVTHISGRMIARLADQFLPYMGGYRSSDVQPVRDAALLAPRPLLVIHGTADETIPVEHALQVYRAARQPKDLWLAEGASHCGAYFLDRPYYCERAIGFFARYLGEGTQERSGTIRGEETA